MRIALAHKYYRLTGGAEVFFRETERILRENGNETLMIAASDPAQIDDEAAAAVKSSRLTLLPEPAYNSSSTLTKLRSLPAAIYDRDKQRRVKAALQAFKPDIFHVFSVNVQLSPSIVVAAAELGIPIVGSFNDYKHICPNYKLFHHGHICEDCRTSQFYRAIGNRCCKDSLALSTASALEAYVHKWLGIYERFDHFTFSSDFMARTTQQFWKQRTISWSKFRNPFNSGQYAAPDDYADYGLYFGRIIEEKGVDLLIDASDRIGAFPLKIIGDGPDLERLQALARSRGLHHVEFLGPMWGEPLNRILSRARFVVVPSIWHENFPYVINQAFAFGRPVIGANRGGIPELVQHETRGLVFDPDHPDQLAASIQRLAENVAESERWGKAAKTWADNQFCDDVAYSELKLAYRTAIHENHRHRR